MTPDVIVIGGGLHGCAAAMNLSARQCRVLVLERSAVARHASGASAGGVRTLNRDLAEVPLSLIAARMWDDIESLVDDDCDYHAHGQLRVAETEVELASLEARRQQMLALGYSHEVVIDQAELRRRAPTIGPQCVGALMVETDGAADPYRTTHAFRRKAERLGAQFIEGACVTALSRQGTVWQVTTPAARYEAPTIVNCAGAWSDEIAAMIGDRAPLQTRCSMMMVSERVAPFLGPVVSAVNRKLSFKQTDDGTVVIGGGHQGRPDRAHESYQLDGRRLGESATAVAAIFPTMRRVRIVRAWAGLEAQTPDHLPIIGPSPSAPGFFHAFGFSGHGFQPAPAVGRALADLVIDGGTQMPIAPFALDRFATSGKAA
ncbi:MAG: FAD-binding oxidoreductase [Alphaproteobacteria bacterium]|nr:FAD-binding oxidoreductase [Alphaproteobacteria bacterium]